MNSVLPISPLVLDDRAIEQLSRTILDACPPGSRVILFGSRARGTHRPDSDIDLMVVLPAKTNTIAEAARLMQVVRPLRLYPEIIVTSRDIFEAWKDVINTIYNEAARDGRVFT